MISVRACGVFDSYDVIMPVRGISVWSQKPRSSPWAGQCNGASLSHSRLCAQMMSTTTPKLTAGADQSVKKKKEPG